MLEQTARRELRSGASFLMLMALSAGNGRSLTVMLPLETLMSACKAGRLEQHLEVSICVQFWFRGLEMTVCRFGLPMEHV